jgi:hypothetical protein
MYHCTREERFRHVSSRSLNKCDILNEKEEIKVTIPARLRRGPSSSFPVIDLPYQPELFSFFCPVLDYLCGVIPYSKMACLHTLGVLLSNDSLVGACKCDEHSETRGTQQEAAFLESGEH